MLGECPYCSPSGLQAGINPPKDRKERAMREGERENSTKGKGGLYNMPQNPSLPPKWPRSGVTFHYQSSTTTCPSVHNKFSMKYRPPFEYRTIQQLGTILPFKCQISSVLRWLLYWGVLKLQSYAHFVTFTRHLVFNSFRLLGSIYSPNSTKIASYVDRVSYFSYD